MDELKEQVLSHDYAIKDISKSMKCLIDESKASNDKLDKVVSSMGKQELILERLTNLEGTTKDSINRVHKRVDGLELQAKEYMERGTNKGCNALQVAIKERDILTAKLEESTTSTKHRLDALDDTVVWVTRSIIGALITGTIGLLFYMIDTH